MNSIILLGSGGHCKSCIEVIEKNNEYEIKGIIEKSYSSKKEFMGYKILGNDKQLEDCFKEKDYGLVCVGQIKTPDVRIELFNLLKKKGFNIAIVKSSNSIISNHSKIGIGTIIMHNSVINAGSKIGANCIINTNSIVEHDVIVKDHSHISTGVILNGGVEIGKGSFVGSGTIIKEGIKIGDKVLVSAGEVILKDIPSNTMYKTTKAYS